MQEIKGDIFDYLNDFETNAICIFTNAVIDRFGYGVAGAGQAKTASLKWYNFKSLLGKSLNVRGNKTVILGSILDDSIIEFDKNKMCLIAFPTKEHFSKPSLLKLIIKSAQELKNIADFYNFKKIILGPPGCGLGGLNWQHQVKPSIETILDDRFIIVHKG